MANPRYYKCEVISYYLVLSFHLHQVSGPFQRSAGTDLVHKSQQNPVLSSPLHQVSGPFQRSVGALKAEKENGRGHSPFLLSRRRPSAEKARRLGAKGTKEQGFAGICAPSPCRPSAEKVRRLGANGTKEQDNMK